VYILVSWRPITMSLKAKHSIDICDLSDNALFLHTNSLRNILKKVIEHKMRVLVFIIISDRIIYCKKGWSNFKKNERMSSCKVTVIIVRFSLKLNFHNRLMANSQEIIFKKSVHWEPSCSMLTNGKNEPNSRLSQICEDALKSIQNQIHF
jgi:hypothetical protein